MGAYKLHSKEICQNKYNDIGIAFGYLDQIPHDQVQDRIYNAKLRSLLLQNCYQEENILCGFENSPDDPSLLIKDNISIKIISSSLSTSNQYNISLEKQYQNSEFAAQLYKHFIQNFDVVYYMGHSRKGGGPDFLPPKLTIDRKVDYAFYQQNTPGLKNLLSSLQNTHVHEIGLYSCDSEKNFKDLLVKKFPSIKFNFTDKVSTPVEAFQLLKSDLRKFIRKCYSR